ncbi:MAG TPA: hypothetical protein VJT71_05205 [Pyrinomonadaceae bacterium]|nr:hypothetical protein [Pyrinomonadaceae bacterium]
MRTIGSALVLLLAISAAFTQNQKQPQAQETRISLEGFLTEGGVVNIAEGEVSLLTQDAPPQAVLAMQELKNGDAIETGQDGRAEVLLNPGYYLRLSANTRLVFVDLAPNNLDLRITQGTAIIEISQMNQFHTARFDADYAFSLFFDPVTVKFPQNQFSIVAGGIYRFEVKADGATQLRIPRGRAYFAGQRIGKETSAEFRHGVTTLGKIDAKEMDAFDLWSQDRAKIMVELNNTLKNTRWYKTLQENKRSYLNIEYDTEDRQARENHTVSALGGYVTFVQPGVFVRSEGSDWTPLIEQGELKYGDGVKTDADGRAHIQLYGTCALFLASNTEIIYGVRPDGDAAIKVLRGSALVFFTYGEKERAARPVITLASANAEFEILRDGIYQLTASNNSSEMNLYIGRVKLAGRVINDEKKVLIRDGTVELQNLNSKQRDSFYVWSVKRMAALTRARRVKLNGMWFFDREANIHTFVPGTRPFRSPYGGDYKIRFMRDRPARLPFGEGLH